MFVAVVTALTALTTRADDWAPNLTLAATWQSNATHAETDADKISALQTEADLIAAERFEFGRHDSLHASAHGAVEWWPRFKSLFRAAGGARLEWRHTFGPGPLAPIFSAELGADAVAADEAGRRGTSTVATFGARKRFNDRWRAALTHEVTRHHARFAVFDSRGSETKIELGRDVTDVARLTFALRYRDGDVLSYVSSPSLELTGVAHARLPVETFGRTMEVHAIDARTLGAKAGLIRALDEYTALLLSYEYRDTERGAFRFKNHLTSLAIVCQF